MRSLIIKVYLWHTDTLMEQEQHSRDHFRYLA